MLVRPDGSFMVTGLGLYIVRAYCTAGGETIAALVALGAAVTLQLHPWMAG